MLCQTCNKKVAVVHSTEMAAGKIAREVHLCEACAAEAGLPPSSKVLSISTSDLFGLLNLGRAVRKETDVECPSCGMRLQEFRVKGRLGCPRDYEIFRSQLEALLEKVQGSPRHVGRKPSRRTERPSPEGASPEGRTAPRRPATAEKTLDSLRRRLAQAVKEEKYEDAGRLRDQIADLERRKHAGPPPARA